MTKLRNAKFDKSIGKNLPFFQQSVISRVMHWHCAYVHYPLAFRFVILQRCGKKELAELGQYFQIECWPLSKRCHQRFEHDKRRMRKDNNGVGKKATNGWNWVISNL
jgi:hypothetical protein